MVVAVDIIEQAVRPGEAGFTKELADYLLTLDLPEQVKVRCDELSAKAQEATLTAEESSELDAILSANSVLMMFQAKARLSLKTPRDR